MGTLEGHTGSIDSVAVSPDRKFIVTGSWDNTAKMWDSTTKECVGTLEGHYNDSVAVSPDGKFIVTGVGTIRPKCGTALRRSVWALWRSY